MYAIHVRPSTTLWIDNIVHIYIYISTELLLLDSVSVVCFNDRYGLCMKCTPHNTNTKPGNRMCRSLRQLIIFFDFVPTISICASLSVNVNLTTHPNFTYCLRFFATYLASEHDAWRLYLGEQKGRSSFVPNGQRRGFARCYYCYYLCYYTCMARFYFRQNMFCWDLIKGLCGWLHF